LTNRKGYLYASFTDTSCNFGNHIIELATRELLASYGFPSPANEFDSFKPGVQKGIYDFVLVPGCTMITAGQNPGLDNIETLGCPIYCLAGSIWMALPHPGYLLRSKIVKWSNLRDLDLSIVRKMAQPVGARDRFTYDLLRSADIHALYVGCPTLLLSQNGVADDGYVLMSLGRGHTRTQTYIAQWLSRTHAIVGIVHETDDYARFQAAGWRLPLIQYQGNLDLYLSYFRRASAVITGRLHGVLPSIAFGKPVFYYGTRDTRTTILDDLGVPIHSYWQLGTAVQRASRSYNRHVLAFFKSNWDELLRQTLGPYKAQLNG
jgi:hypothetical protein